LQRAARPEWLFLALVTVLLLVAAPVAAEERLELTISGLEGELLDNVRASLTLEQRRRRPGLTAGTIADLHAQAEGEIARALEPFGYYRPQIRTELRRPASAGASWEASYEVTPGSPLPIAGLDIGFRGGGAADPELLALADGLPLQSDPVLDHRRYEAAKQALIAGARARGYLDATFEVSRVEVDPAAYAARIRILLDTGPRYVFGPIEFEDSRFDPDYLAGYLEVKPGDPFSEELLALQRLTLSRSGYFREVIIQRLPVIDGPQPAIPVRILLQPYQPNLYRGRIGWGTDTGLGVQLDWTRRYLGSRGHRLTMGVTAVEERNRLAGNLNYTLPLQPRTRSRIELIARHESKDLTFDDVDLDEGGETRIATNMLSGLWHLPRAARGDFAVEQALGLSLVTETYDVFEVLFGNLPQESQDILIDRIGAEAYATLAPEFEALVPNYRLTLRRSDDRLFIRDGDYINLLLLGADESLGSNLSFWQASLRSWHIRPLFDRHRLLLRTAIGYSEAESRRVLGANFNQMPEFYEFRAGGGRSVRGYGFEALFPADALTGGKHQLIGSLEYEHNILPDWGAAIFVDAGNAFNDFDDIDAKVGVGLGLRWRSPVGLARIDLGFPLDDADDSFQVYITVGPEF
jgi:translocation and assembly module TamA